MKRKAIGILVAAIFAGASAGAAAADGSAVLQSETQRTDALSARHGQTLVQTRIASQFSAFAGSEENAQSLVTGLRSGTPITLSAPASGGTRGTTLTPIDPGTRPMGHGNVFISLALAQQQLTRYGITNPTPQEIQAALTGGTITSASGQPVELQGVLTQRASGQGWGAIARSQGTNLGHVISGLKGMNQQVTVHATTTTQSAGGAATAAGSRPQSASTALHGSAAGDVAAPPSGKGGFGGNAAGIVNAGGHGGGASVHAGARAHGSSGIVTGAGVGVSGRGAVSPGLAKGHGKP
jgi:hypothetical protein